MESNQVSQLFVWWGGNPHPKYVCQERKWKSIANSILHIPKLFCCLFFSFLCFALFFPFHSFSSLNYIITFSSFLSILFHSFLKPSNQVPFSFFLLLFSTNLISTRKPNWEPENWASNCHPSLFQFSQTDIVLGSMK